MVRKILKGWSLFYFGAVVLAAFNEAPVKAASGSCTNIGFGREREDPADWKESAANVIKKKQLMVSRLGEEKQYLPKGRKEQSSPSSPPPHFLWRPSLSN